MASTNRHRKHRTDPRYQGQQTLVDEYLSRLPRHAWGQAMLQLGILTEDVAEYQYKGLNELKRKKRIWYKALTN